MGIQLISASHYSIEELTAFYNRTRVDYLVPMPMSVEVMSEYIHDFDIDLEHSFVAVDDQDGETLGLGMLGMRGHRGWITRLGVIPSIRRRGAGAAIFDGMVDAAKQLGATELILEVIKNNIPAQGLFISRKFQFTDEYLVLRRAPLPIKTEPTGKINWLYRKKALEALRSYPYPLTWINDLPSMENASAFQGFSVELPNGGKGWLLFRHKKFSLTHFVFHTTEGDPVEVVCDLLLHLHQLHRRTDAYAENIRLDDPALNALTELGYFEAFRRIEMVKRNL